jgi:hypothetical protein
MLSMLYGMCYLTWYALCYMLCCICYFDLVRHVHYVLSSEPIHMEAVCEENLFEEQQVLADVQSCT